MQLEELSIEDLGFTNVLSQNHADVFLDEKRGVVVCILNTDYVPIADFRNLFNEITQAITDKNITKFVFDKRALRTFHQPSMEWYFIEWKTAMFKNGLTIHRKILPDLPWFAKAVEIARKPLMEKFPEDMKKGIDIGYRDTLEEAINS